MAIASVQTAISRGIQQRSLEILLVFALVLNLGRLNIEVVSSRHPRERNCRGDIKNIPFNYML